MESTGAVASLRSKPLSLDDLPTEILEQIAGYLCGAPDATIRVSRRRGTSFSQSAIRSGAVREHFSTKTQAYPSALLLVNRRVSEVVFSQLWRQTVFVLDMASSDALCFLKWALSDRQRAALRRIRLPRFMLSWDDPVGHDIWLAEHKRESAFHAAMVKPTDVPRLTNLVACLQDWHPAVQAMA